MAGVRVLDTDEAFTCVQTDTGIEFIDGLDETKVDYTAVLRFMTNPLISFLINRKRVVHIELLSPDSVQENHAYYTLLGVSKQWLMLDGHHGIPDRIFRMNHLNVLEISNRVTATVRTGGWIGWARLAMWYVGWRNKGQSGPSH